MECLTPSKTHPQNDFQQLHDSTGFQLLSRICWSAPQHRPVELIESIDGRFTNMVN